MKISHTSLLWAILIQSATGEKSSSFGIQPSKVELPAAAFGMRQRHDSNAVRIADTTVASARGGGAATEQGFSLAAALQGFVLWAIPCAIFIQGLPVTATFKLDLNKVPRDKFIDELPWKHIFDVGGKNDILNHMKYGQPAMILYQIGAFLTFVTQNAGAVWQKFGAVFNVGGAVFFAACLIAIFPLLKKIIFNDKGGQIAPYIGGLFLGIATVPFLQLVVWQIEYALRALFGQPGKNFLPTPLLKLVRMTNSLQFLVGPMKTFFKWKIFSPGYQQAGLEVVDAINNAKLYTEPGKADKLTMEQLTSINRSLVVQILYSGLAVVPLWAVLTHFGIYAVDSPPCMGGADPAKWGVIGMAGPYWILSFGWLLWGVLMFEKYNVFFKK